MLPLSYFPKKKYKKILKNLKNFSKNFDINMRIRNYSPVINNIYHIVNRVGPRLMIVNRDEPFHSE